MKTTTAFRALRNRDLNKTNATKQYVVRPLNKDGSLSRARMTQQDWQMDAFVEIEKADARVRYLMSVNPGKYYVVRLASEYR